MKKKIGVLLSGCGNRDGSEIHESVLALLAIDQMGAEAICFAPDLPTREVVNFYKGEQVKNETRNQLLEAARIARGNIKPIDQVGVEDLHGLVIPGGSGSALKNLSTYAYDGVQANINPAAKQLILDMFRAGKPIGSICAATMLLGLILLEVKGQERISLTVGKGSTMQDDLINLGYHVQECEAVDCVLDEKHHIVSTPAYINKASVSEICQGIQKAVKQVVEWS